MSRTIVTFDLRSTDVAEDAEHAVYTALSRHHLDFDSLSARATAADSLHITLTVITHTRPSTVVRDVRAALKKAGLISSAVVTVDPALYPQSEVVDRVAAVIRAIIPVTGLEEQVTDRFPDEIEWHRDGDWLSFSERREQTWRLRTERAARAAVAEALR